MVNQHLAGSEHAISLRVEEGERRADLGPIRTVSTHASHSCLTECQDAHTTDTRTHAHTHTHNKYLQSARLTPMSLPLSSPRLDAFPAVSPRHRGAIMYLTWSLSVSSSLRHQTLVPYRHRGGEGAHSYQSFIKSRTE